MRGVKGKDGGKPKAREVKVGVVGTYRRLDKKRRPVRGPGMHWRFLNAAASAHSPRASAPASLPLNHGLS